MVDRGAKLEFHPNNHGLTPLCYAAQNGRSEIVRLLVERGANLDHQSNNGATPLCMASQQGHLETARLLLDNGAIIDRQNHEGGTPLDYALKRGGGAHDIVFVLVQAAARQGYVSLLKRVLLSNQNPWINLPVLCKRKWNGVTG
jgi:ankyrin repeat protein